MTSSEVILNWFKCCNSSLLQIIFQFIRPYDIHIGEVAIWYTVAFRNAANILGDVVKLNLLLNRRFVVTGYCMLWMAYIQYYNNDASHATEWDKFFINNYEDHLILSFGRMTSTVQ